MFTVCDVLVVNKIDYLALSDFDLEVMKERVLALNPKIKIFEVSAKTGEGVETWADWLKKEAIAFSDPGS
jgi:hydrogenase nickel incorporation protein HypB